MMSNVSSGNMVRDLLKCFDCTTKFSIELKELVDNIFADFKSDSSPDDYKVRKWNSIRNFCVKFSGGSTPEQLKAFIKGVQSCAEEGSPVMNRYNDNYKHIIRCILNSIKECLESAHARSAEIMSPMSVEEFEQRLDNVWINRCVIPFAVSDFISLVKEKCKDNNQLHLFVNNIDNTINKYGNNMGNGIISDVYLRFLEEFKSCIAHMIIENQQKAREKETMFKSRSKDFNEKTIENITFLTERYRAALSEIAGTVDDDAKKYVYGAVMFIAHEISDTDVNGTKELMSRIKAVPDYRNNPTYDIAIDIMSEWDWRKFEIDLEASRIVIKGPEIVKDSIKKAILTFGKAIEPFICCDTGGPSWTFWQTFDGTVWKREQELRNGEKVIVLMCMDKPDQSYPEKSVSVRSTVKICDGEERFWVKVVKIENGRYYGRISNNLVGDKGYNRGDVVVFGLEKIWDIEDADPKRNLFFLGVTREQFCDILLECCKKLKLGDSEIRRAICLIRTLVLEGQTVGEMMEILSKQGRGIAEEILMTIYSRYDNMRASSIVLNPRLSLRDCIIIPVLKEILHQALDGKKPQSEGVFKSGDRVCFIKQNIHSNYTQPYMEHLYLGIVKDWAVGSQGMVHCTFDYAFNVMSLETLDLDIAGAEDVGNLINHEDFPASLMRANPNVLRNAELTHSVYGDITLCPVDERHFPKLNEILAKVIAKDKHGQSIGDAHGR